MKRLVAIADSPKLTTGFGTVSAAIYPYFNEKYDFVAYGAMDFNPDVNNTLGYKFYPTQLFDPLGTQGMGIKFILAQQPDVVWLLFDPGNIRTYLHMINKIDESERPKVVVYTPIEGFPINTKHLEAFNLLQKMNGVLVLYCESSKELLETYYKIYYPEEPLPKIFIANHGNDHANFQQYNTDVRNKLREVIGWNDYFIVGSGGVNKRTKGLDNIVYTAAELKSRPGTENIKFYLHTDPDWSTMGGYSLKDLVMYYDVFDKIMFKPDNNKETRGDINLGVERVGNIDWILSTIKPDNPEVRRIILSQYDFVSRLNCLDMYLDLSQVEGWGLFPCEAMACGVPTACLNDFSVRQEIHCQAAYTIDPIDPDLWSTWHTGVRLPQADPKVAADVIMKFYEDPALCLDLSKKGLDLMSNYKWEDCAKVMIEAIESVLNE